MVSNKYRSRTYKRTRKVTPGGKNVLRHSLRPPKKAHCASCGGLLHGVARGRPSAIKKLSKTQKRPERPYAGKLCSKCMRAVFVKKARA